MRSTTLNVNGTTFTVELRRSAPCQAGWGRIWASNATPMAIQFTAWNPGGPSQDLVPGTNYTTEVNGATGQQVCAGFQAYRNDGLGHWIHVGWYFTGCATA